MKADKVRERILQWCDYHTRQRISPMLDELIEQVGKLEAKAQSCEYWHNQYLELQKQVNQADGFSYSE